MNYEEANYEDTTVKFEPNDDQYPEEGGEPNGRVFNNEYEAEEY